MPDPQLRLEYRGYGDAALLIDVIGQDYEERWSVAQLIGRSLKHTGQPGYLDVVASYDSVVVFFDPLVTDSETMAQAVDILATQSPSPPAGTVHEIPVAYGGQDGPDLEAVADALGLHPQEVVDLHVAADWVVRFRGSPAGAPMLDGWHPGAAVARLAQPRARVQRGSVGVSGLQSTIYNAPSPGGWRLIGRTAQRLFNLDRSPPIDYLPGDRVRFVAVETSHGD